MSANMKIRFCVRLSVMAAATENRTATLICGINIKSMQDAVVLTIWEVNWPKIWWRSKLEARELMPGSLVFATSVSFLKCFKCFRLGILERNRILH